jgi:Flp pilus assembly protein TadG
MSIDQIDARPTRRASQRPDGERGIVTIEAIILMPLLFLLIFAIVQAGLYYHAQSTARSIANGAVQVTRIEDGTAEAGRAEANARLAAVGTGLIANPGVDVVRGVEESRVTVTGRAPTIIGIPFTVRQTATGPTERWVAQ